jgi:hypothetical protein
MHMANTWNEATDRLNRWMTNDDETALYFATVANRELAVARGMDGEAPEERAARRVAAEIRIMFESTYLSADFIEVAKAFVRGAA